MKVEKCCVTFPGETQTNAYPFLTGVQWQRKVHVSQRLTWRTNESIGLLYLTQVREGLPQRRKVSPQNQWQLAKQMEFQAFWSTPRTHIHTHNLHTLASPKISKICVVRAELYTASCRVQETVTVTRWGSNDPLCARFCKRTSTFNITDLQGPLHLAQLFNVTDLQGPLHLAQLFWWMCCYPQRIASTTAVYK